MAERSGDPAESVPSSDPPEEATPRDTAATPDRVREVVGRRGYDEGEDEAATEDEEH